MANIPRSHYSSLVRDFVLLGVLRKLGRDTGASPGPPAAPMPPWVLSLRTLAGQGAAILTFITDQVALSFL